MWGAEMGANEHGVVIGNEAVFTRAGFAPRGLLGMDLLRLGLERGASAEEAASVIESLVARHGQGGRAGYDDPTFRYHNSFLIADRHEAYVVETAGREHARERVRDGTRAISNGLTIDAFAARHADPIRGAVAQCVPRRRRVEQLATGICRPDEVARVLRDHGEGHEQPYYHPLNGAMSAPCMHAGGKVASSQTVASWISRLDDDGARHWATGTAAPCLSAFKPIALDTPLDLGAPTGVMDDTSAWWSFEELHRCVIGDDVASAALRRARDGWERWDDDEPERRWEQWRDFVAEQRTSLRETRDGRPGFVRRYWRARRADARAAVPKLPARP
ncbi:MAG TPA: peptidase family C69 [Polyangiaceae bacterium]|nr:peptidase family C69 [Polyangiaceae bacterium]